MRGRDKRVVLHVGAHKTGTTTIQQYLLAHRESLRRRGVRYVPRAELSPLVGWGEQLVASPDGFAALVADFGAARRERVLLASHENMCGRPFARVGAGLYADAPASIEALARMTAAHDTHVLLTIRPPHELLESFYLQGVNMGGQMRFPRWLERLDLDALSWRPLVETLRASFARVSVVDFGTIRAGAPAYVTDALRRVGVDVEVDASWLRPLNPSVSELGLRLLLRGNGVLADEDDRNALRSFVQRHFNNRTGERPQLLDEDTRVMLRDRYAAEYAELTAA